MATSAIAKQWESVDSFNGETSLAWCAIRRAAQQEFRTRKCYSAASAEVR
jgi:hypothetical protein